MDETTSLVDTLKRVLRSKDITYAQIAKELQISEASVKRVFSEKSFTLERFERMCHIAGLSIAEIAALSRNDAGATQHTYTLEQERFFADNPKYLAFFDLLLRFGSIKKVMSYRPHLTDKVINNYLKKIEALGLIECMPGNRVNFPVSRNVSWQRNGPLRKKFLSLAKSDFIGDDFTGELAAFEFSGIGLTAKSARKITESLKEIAAEVRYTADMESKIDAETNNYGFMIAIRPWKLAVLEDC